MPRIAKSQGTPASRQTSLSLALALAAASSFAAVSFAHAQCSGALQESDALWTLASPGLPALAPGSNALRAYFGHTIVVGDFDGDGDDELAISHRQAVTPPPAVNRGAVVVLDGSVGGLSAQGSRTLTGSTVDANTQHGFGDAMAVADFNADGFDDLAIAATGRGQAVAGKVYVFHGGPGGLDPLQAQTWDRDVAGIAGDAGNEDGFGNTLVAGNFDGDAFADLAIGAGRGFEPSPQLHPVAHVLFGSAQGLQATDSVALQFPSSAGASDKILPRLAVDTNTDGSAELLVTFSVNIPEVAPLACLAHALRSASVAWTCFGTHSSSTNNANNDPGGIAAGDFDDDGHEDIAVGQSTFTVNGRPRAGRVLVFRGAGTVVGVLEPTLQVLVSTVADSAGTSNLFGINLAATDLDGDGRVDLAIGEPGHSASSGVAAAGLLHWHRGIGASGVAPFDVIPAAEIAALLPLAPDLGFSEWLATGDFDGNGCPDIAAALPSRGFDGLMSAGAVAILRGGQQALFENGFED